MRKLQFMCSILLSLMIIDIINVSASFSADEPEFKDATPQLERVRDGIPHFLAMIEAKEDIKVAYFGGSITAAGGWRVQTLAKFNETYAGSKFTEINAAIGGTGSDLGVYRQEYDVLRHDPDLVFVEFCVNDGGTPPQLIWRQMEGIVRQIWRHDIKTDIVFVYTYRVGHESSYLNDKTPRSVSAMEQVADFYGIPTLDFNIPVVELHEKGELTYQSAEPEEGKIHFSTDGVHPNLEGHQIYTKVVCDAFQRMFEENKNKPYPSVDSRKAKLEKTFIADNYERAKLVPIKESQLSGEWQPLSDDSPISWIKSRMGNVVYTSDVPGAKLTFKFKGSHVALYDILGPNCGQVWVTVDGKKNGPIPRFDSYCSYHRLATLHICSGLDPNIEHEAVVEIDSEQPDRSSVAKSLENPKDIEGPKYQGRNVWIGPIMIIGEVVD